MPLNIPDSFKTAKNAEANAPIFLYTLYDYDGAGTDLHFAEWDSNVTFDGIEYAAFPIHHDEISENSEGSINSVRLTLGNASRLIQSYLELYDLRNKKVRIRLVWNDDLSDPDNKVDFLFYIDSYSAAVEAAEFVLLPKVDVLSLQLPKRIYARNYCQWRFKGTQCGYAGSQTTCNRTFQRCRELANQVRFGGFPSIPSRNVYVS